MNETQSREQHENVYEGGSYGSLTMAVMVLILLVATACSSDDQSDQLAIEGGYSDSKNELVLATPSDDNHEFTIVLTEPSLTNSSTPDYSFDFATIMVSDNLSLAGYFSTIDFLPENALVFENTTEMNSFLRNKEPIIFDGVTIYVDIEKNLSLLASQNNSLIISINGEPIPGFAPISQNLIPNDDDSDEQSLNQESTRQSVPTAESTAVQLAAVATVENVESSITPTTSLPTMQSGIPDVPIDGDAPFSYDSENFKQIVQTSSEGGYGDLAILTQENLKFITDHEGIVINTMQYDINSSIPISDRPNVMVVSIFDDFPVNLILLPFMYEGTIHYALLDTHNVLEPGGEGWVLDNSVKNSIPLQQLGNAGSISNIIDMEPVPAQASEIQPAGNTIITEKIDINAVVPPSEGIPMEGLEGAIILDSSSPTFQNILDGANDGSISKNLLVVDENWLENLTRTGGLLNATTTSDFNLPIMTLSSGEAAIQNIFTLYRQFTHPQLDLEETPGLIMVGIFEGREVDDKAIGNLLFIPFTHESKTFFLLLNTDEIYVLKEGHWILGPKMPKSIFLETAGMPTLTAAQMFPNSFPQVEG